MFMSQIAVIICLALVGSANVVRAGKCSDHVLSMKADGGWSGFDGEESGSSNQYDFTACSAVFSTFERHLPQVHNLINEHIAQSFVYSIMSSHFDTDAENRLGFGKYLADLADTMWNNAVEIVKYTGKRGGSVAPLMDNSSGTGLRISGDLNQGIRPWTEIEALALVHDQHLALSSKIHHLHGSTRDTSLGHFLENQFVNKNVELIRQLSGFLTNLVPMSQETSGSDLALYLFDQSLA
ncbi:ferritin-1 heavy chain-like [Daphnia pulex]|uniref:ferritin-1 heavy chain-like n=1 Tax=Daphnia pulex TaxID=6669 RepID=UPI001EE02E03|nr:ferritin-1 heavy chain-like [Daphnia pulex]